MTFFSCPWGRMASRLLTSKVGTVGVRRGLVLGIETSCDDTGAAVISMEGKVLGEALHSQLSSRMGGIIPTFAAQFHREKIEGVVSSSMAMAGLTSPSQLTAVAVTNRPGLKAPLSVGTDYAKLLCMKHQLPLIPVHHMEAHALTARLDKEVEFPFMVLLISGGHCLLARAEDIDQFSLLGTSVDDSPGEALDKCARMLKLHTLPGMRDVSGGRAVELVAASSLARGEKPVELKVPMRDYRNCRFSFAGVKAQVWDHLLRGRRSEEGLVGDRLVSDVGAVCSGLQHVVAKHLCERVQRGVEYLGEQGRCRTLVVSGGVASNMYIRQALTKVAEQKRMSAVFPPPRLCTDNGVMIAWAGLERLRRGMGVVGHQEVLGVQLETRCPLGVSVEREVEEANIKCKWIKI